jgi:Flp pilus assembly protein TadD
MKFFLFLLALFVPVSAFAHYEGELLPDSVAVMEYSMVISMAPKDTLTRNKLGMVYIRQNKLAKAREQFLEILKINSQDFDALDSLGLVCDREAKYAEAAQWYGKALKVKPADAGVRQRYEVQ